MKTLYLALIFFSLITSFLSAQTNGTFIESIDPNSEEEYQTDKGYRIWSIDSFLYVLNGYINLNGYRALDIFKINIENRETINRIAIDGPQEDMAISDYWITPDQHILITGEWRDYDALRMRTFIAKLDKNLEIIWINYYPDLSDGHLYGDALAQTATGDILLYLTEGEPEPGGNPWVTVSSRPRIVKTDPLGSLIFNKIIPDTFQQSFGYGHLAPTDDGNFLMSSTVLGYYYHPIYGTYRYNVIVHKIDSEANPVWSRMVNYTKFPIQEPVATTLAGGGGAVMWAKDTFVPDPTIAFNFNVLNRYNSAGGLSWTHEWNDVAQRVVYRIITAQNGDILGSGYYDTAVPLSKGKGWLFRMTPDGEVLWERHYSDSIQRPWAPLIEFLDLCELDDGRIAATGILFDLNSDGALNPNVALLLVDDQGCLVPGCSGVDHYITSAFEPIIRLPDLPLLSISPNPTPGPFRVQLPEALKPGKNWELRCYDLQGKLWQQLPWPKGDTALNIDGSSWAPGLYLPVLFENNRPVATGKIIIQP